jgi:phosphatidylglycerophosphatase C
MNKIIAFFDFDGTITKRDTFIEFIKFCFGSYGLVTGLMLFSPVIALYKIGIIPNFKAKEMLFKYYFKNWTEVEFNNKCLLFTTEVLNGLIKTEALHKLKWHLDGGHRIAIVSASVKNWIAPWCALYNIETIATEIDIQNAKLTGMFRTKNCYGKEKVKRIKESVNLQDYKTVYAYGDSNGDKEMLELANYKFYRAFKNNRTESFK